MHSVWLLSVWLHILAAIVWIGGMLFLVMVVVPWLRTADRVQAVALLSATGRRFRTIAWWCFGLLTVTGLFNLYVRGVKPGDFLDPDWLVSPFGHAVVLKLLLFAVVLGISAVHDFSLGPRATEAAGRDPRGAETERLRRAASWLGRANVVLALLLVAAGVMIVRGWPS
jgi:uncharacterized membrane protein